MVRKALATKVNSQITLNAIFGGLHFPKGGNLLGRTLLFTNVKTVPKGENVSGHMWARTNEYMQYEKFNKGDEVQVVGTVIKYFKYNGNKPKKDFSIDLISLKKIDIDDRTEMFHMEQKCSGGLQFPQL